MNYQFQKTLQKAVTCEGIGLHSGKNVQIKLRPAPAGVGIVFCRTDVTSTESIIHANFKNVTKTTLGTTITNEFGVEVATIEHLMAALWGAGVDNAIIELNSPEIPIMDGSSEPFIALINQVGTKTLQSPRKILRILDEIRVGDKKRSAKIIPANGFAVRFDIDFKDEAIAKQRNKFNLDESSFNQEIAAARTFCMKSEVEQMHAAGLALGGSLDNAIVVDKGEVLNEGGLRFEDEFVRHKILDSVGDLFLAGYRIEGEFIGHKSGHGINNEILRTLMDNEKAWTIVDAGTPIPVTTPAPAPAEEEVPSDLVFA